MKRLPMSQGVIIAALVSFQIVVSLLIQVVVVKTVGVSADTDVFVALQSLSLVMLTIFSATAQGVWLPRFSTAALNQGGLKGELSVSLGQMTILGVLFVFLFLSSYLWLPHVVSAAEYSKDYSLVSFSLLSSGFVGSLSVLMTFAMRAKGQFVLGESMPLVAGILGLIGVIFLTPYYGVESAAFIIFLRSILLFALQWMVIGKPSVSIKKAIDQKGLWQAYGALSTAGMLYKTSPLFDRYWIAKDTAGYLTVFSLAYSAMGAFTTIVDRTVCMPSVPRYSRLIAAGDYSGLRREYRYLLFKSFIPIFFAFLVALLFREQLTCLVEGFIFGPEMARFFWLVCFLLLGYSYGSVSGSVVGAVFYAMGKTLVPIKIGVWGFLLSLVFRFIAFLCFGTLGVIAMISVYYLASFVVLLIFLEYVLREKIS